MRRLLLCGVSALVLGLALAGCSSTQQRAIQAFTEEGIESVRASNDNLARVYYAVPCQMPLGGAIRTLAGQQLADQIRACGGPSFVPAGETPALGITVRVVPELGDKPTP